MHVTAAEGRESMVAVDVGEEEVGEFFDLVLSENHFGQARLATALTVCRCSSDGARLAVWVRPALGVFQTVDEVTNVVAAAEIGEDRGEAVHGDG
jgi:hypothetical protein